jgi:hydrogenase large subunit
MDVYKKRGPSVFLRILARFYECSKLTLAIGNWLNEIEPGEPFYKKPTPIENGKSYGLTEAPRGSLGHWCTVEDSKIKKYQVITPTTWNASPRDSHGVPGAIEQALEGVAIKDEKRPIEAIHVVRSFDPCMACSVHVIKPRSTYWAITTVTSSHT